jgi:hypothetical protein
MRQSIQSDGMPCLRIVSRNTTCTSSRRGAFTELLRWAVVSLSWNCEDAPPAREAPVPPPRSFFSSPMRPL